MSNNMATYMANKILDLILKDTAWSLPTSDTVWLALFTTSANETELQAGTLTNEVTGGSYARLEINDVAKTFNAASSGATENSADWEFIEATGSWGTVGYLAVMDTVTGGNVLFAGALDTTKAVASGEIFRLKSGDLDISLT